MLVYIFSDSCVRKDIQVTRDVIERFKDSYDYQILLMSNVDSSINVMERFTIAEKLLEQIKNDTANSN